MSFPTHHLYVHVPFCRLVCAYCDFVTVGGRAAEIAGYPDLLLAELALRESPGELATIYFGGGTHPSSRPMEWHAWCAPPWTDGGTCRPR